MPRWATVCTVITVSAMMSEVALAQAPARGSRGPAPAANPTWSVSEVMSPEQFRKAGLQKLTPEELAQLSTWVRSYATIALVAGLASGAREDVQVGNAPKAVGATGQSLVAPGGCDLVARSRISGNFDGWSGNTVFELENGQRWQQATHSTFVARASRPEVTICRAPTGYEMRVEDVRQRVNVNPL